MARSPFQGTYQPNARPTVVTAPDALVYLNGEQDLVGCPSCRKRFDVSKYITSIQVNLSVDSSPGSATISLSIPRHAIDDFFFDGVAIISPMMEVEIFAKGYFLLEGIPQYYPIFWGLVTEVSDSYSGGEHTVSINCADILKWWEICRMNINPAFTAPAGQWGRSIFGNVLFGTNPYDVIYSLSQMAFGDVLLATGSLLALNKEKEQKRTFDAALKDIMGYWSSRFSKIRSNLLLYGISGVVLRGDTLSEQLSTGSLKGVKNAISTQIRRAQGANGEQVTFDPASENVTAFKTQLGEAGNFDLWQSDYQTKLEVANACKEAIGFEFYMDVTGDIVFKPPFYNLDIMSNKPVSWIQDIDIIDWDFSESEAEVVTQMTIQGNYGGSVDYGFGSEMTPYTSVTDYHLLRQYGWRPHTYNSEFMGNDLQAMFFHGLDVLDRINSKRHQATITIPMRSELRLGFPVYIAPKDQIWYISGISHNLQFGGRATTQLTLTARRGKFIAPKGISTLKTKNKSSSASVSTEGTPSKGSKVKVDTSAGSNKFPSLSVVRSTSFELDLGDGPGVPNVNPEDAGNEPLVLRHPKTGRIVGYPNVVMVYSRPYKPSEGLTEAGRKAPGTGSNVPTEEQARIAQNQAEENRRFADIYGDDAAVLTEKHSHNRYSYGLNSAGVYVYAHDRDGYITQMSLLPADNIKVTQDGSDTSSGVKSRTTLIRPVSDERGFELIGHYRYGRGISLRDGSLVLNEKGPNSRTGSKSDNNTLGNVGDTQVALSGSLLATLNANSQGLSTAVGVKYVDPADAIARLQPEDLQTAAVLVPGETGNKEPQFTDTGTNFVDSAPLGSAEQQGVPVSVEASQLSRALTLAEMTVKLDTIPGEDQCECQLGRADLTFITTGYQVESPIKASTPTPDELLGADLNDLGAAPPQQISSSSVPQPVPATLKGDELSSKVESYLFNLYKALDDSHQAYETLLRGDPEGERGSTTTYPDVVDYSDPSASGVAPPFSALNRAALGDPRATALQGKTSRESISNQFKNFGDDLRKSTKSKKLSVEISNLKAKEARLQSRLRATQSTTRSSYNTDDPKELEKQIAEVQADINQKEGELAQLTVS